MTAKAVAVLLPILGTSWVFGVLAVNSQAMVFQYMFAVLNSLQVRACGLPGEAGRRVSGCARQAATRVGGRPPLCSCHTPWGPTA